jgi:hypothetical protein
MFILFTVCSTLLFLYTVYSLLFFLYTVPCSSITQ